MKTHLVTTTQRTALSVAKTIMQLDPHAFIDYPQECATVLRIRSDQFSFLSFEAMDGVSHSFFESET